MASLDEALDEYHRWLLKQDAWIAALLAHVSGDSSSVRKKIGSRQKRILQKLYERLEKRSPEIAANLDRRKIEDVLGED